MVARSHMVASLTFFLEVLEIFKQVGDILHVGHMEKLLREFPMLEEDHLVSLTRALNPTQHWIAWMLAWSLGVHLGMPGLQQ